MLIQTKAGNFIDSDKIICFAIENKREIILCAERRIFIYAFCKSEQEAKVKLSNLIQKIVFGDDKILYYEGDKNNG